MLANYYSNSIREVPDSNIRTLSQAFGARQQRFRPLVDGRRLEAFAYLERLSARPSDYPDRHNADGKYLITNLNPASTVLKDHYYEIVDRYVNMVMDDAMLQQFYNDYPVKSTKSVLHGFDASITVGP